MVATGQNLSQRRGLSCADPRGKPLWLDSGSPPTKERKLQEEAHRPAAQKSLLDDNLSVTFKSPFFPAVTQQLRTAVADKGYRFPRGDTAQRSAGTWQQQRGYEPGSLLPNHVCDQQKRQAFRQLGSLRTTQGSCD